MKPPEAILPLYEQGQRDFGENKVQELVPKYEALPKYIRWHFIGHLQTNKGKQIAPFVHLIHSVDSLDILKEINKQAKKQQRIIHCLYNLKLHRKIQNMALIWKVQKRYCNRQIINLLEI